MPSTSLLQALFAQPTADAAALLLDVCAHVPGIVFAFSAEGRIVFSGGRDLGALPFDARTTIGADYRQVLAGHDVALRDIARALAGEEFETKSEFLGRYYETRYNPIREGERVVGVIGIAHDVTNHRRMEQELQTSQTLYRTVIETTDTGFVMLDKDGLVVEANDEYLRQAGFESQEQILGRRVTEWTAPHDIERNAEEVEKCLRFGMTRNLRIDYLDAKGHITPIEVNATYVYVGGEPRILALCRDVTERLAAESALLSTEQLSEAVLEAVHEAVVVLDSDGRIVAVNEGWRAFMRGFAFAEKMETGIGADYLALFEHAATEGVEVAATCAAGIRDVLARKKQQHSMEFSVGAGPARRWYLKRATRLERADGRVVVMHVDVTERRRQQELSERSARALNTLLELVPVGVFQTNAQGECVYVNPTWSRITGLPAERAMGHGWSEALHPDDRLRVFAEWERAIAAGAASTIEFRFAPPDREVVWAQVQVVPLRDARGQLQGHIGTVTALSARKARELAREAAQPPASARPARTGSDRGRAASALQRDARTGAFEATSVQAWLADAWRSGTAPSGLALLRLEIDHATLPRARATPAEREEVVRTIARIASSLLREGDVVARHGEEGFLIVLQDASLAGARACAERVRLAVERAAWLGASVTLSVGAAVRAAGGGELEDLFLAADVALEAARQRGGNRVAVADEADGTRA
ncbi:MAG: PAS domain S-box protein [Planctomycetes bacterium]|nr:PAS domain S-box protein [Planctomycetota bacterium]